MPISAFLSPLILAYTLTCLKDMCSSLPSPAAKPLCNRLLQGLPLGSGLGSSAASAAAAAAAVNGLFGGVLPKETLVLAGLKSEAAVSGYHADNIAPALLGGFTLVR